jgi:uncharacterized membrane protein
MTHATLTKVVALGAATGMRSLAGVTALARARGGLAKPVMTLLAAGEMYADKTAAIGNRTDPFPLGGRVLMGAVVGAVVAGERDESPIVGGVIGATAALVATHLAFQVRRRLPLSNVVVGLLEDGLVLAVVSLTSARSSIDGPGRMEATSRVSTATNGWRSDA